MPPTPSFCEKQNTDGIVPLHTQNVKNETFTKIKTRKTPIFVEPNEIFRKRYFFLAARERLCYTKSVSTAEDVRLRRAVFYKRPQHKDTFSVPEAPPARVRIQNPLRSCCGGGFRFRIPALRWPRCLRRPLRPGRLSSAARRGRRRPAGSRCGCCRARVHAYRSGR